MTKLILMRHGQTDWSIKKRYCSFTDIDINDEGKKQAERLCCKLHKEKIHRVYSSDAKRALNFARIVFKGLPVEKIPELREMNFGIFEGLTYQEIMEKYPEIYTKWLSNPFNTIIPKGEGVNELEKKIKRFLRKIISLNINKTIAIVTHAGPIKIIINSILKPKNIWEIKTDLASLSIIEFDKKKAKIQLLNHI